MTTWNVDITETKPGTGLHTTGGLPVTTTLARLGTDDPQVMAAALRALADRLDPPKQSAFRVTATRGTDITYPGPVDADGNLLGRVEALPPVRSRELEVEYLDDEPPATGDVLPELRTGEIEIRTGVGGWGVSRVVRVRRRRYQANRWPVTVVTYIEARDSAGAVIPGAYRQDGVLRMSASEALELGAVIRVVARKAVEAGMQTVDDDRDPAALEVARIYTAEAVRAAGPVRLTPARNLVTPDGCGPEHTYREGCTHADAPPAR